MQQAEREAGDATAEEGDPDYVEALSYGMPPTGGLGLGIDRLAMVMTGRETIRDVILFPALRERELGGDRARRAAKPAPGRPCREQVDAREAGPLAVRLEERARLLLVGPAAASGGERA